MNLSPYQLGPVRCADKPAEKHCSLICCERKTLFRLKKQAEKVWIISWMNRARPTFVVDNGPSCDNFLAPPQVIPVVRFACRSHRRCPGLLATAFTTLAPPTPSALCAARARTTEARIVNAAHLVGALFFSMFGGLRKGPEEAGRPGGGDGRDGNEAEVTAMIRSRQWWRRPGRG
jgi:hypothetical protein